MFAFERWRGVGTGRRAVERLGEDRIVPGERLASR